MFQPKQQSGEIDYPVEGYCLRWGGDGLEIRTTDYHATKLHLSWDELVTLAQRSGWEKAKPAETVARG